MDQSNIPWLKIRSTAAASCLVLLFLTALSIPVVAASRDFGLVVFLTIFGVFVISVLFWFTAALMSSTVRYSLSTMLISYIYIAGCIGAIIRLKSPDKVIGVFGLMGFFIAFALHRYHVSEQVRINKETATVRAAHRQKSDKN